MEQRPLGLEVSCRSAVTGAPRFTAQFLRPQEIEPSSNRWWPPPRPGNGDNCICHVLREIDISGAEGG